MRAAIRNCGCEVEVRQSSGAGSSLGGETSGPRTVGIRDEIFGADTVMDVTYVRAEDAHLPAPVSGIDHSAAKILRGRPGTRRMRGMRRCGAFAAERCGRLGRAWGSRAWQR